MIKLVANPRRRLDWLLLAIPLAAYVAGFALYYPKTVANTDEASYVRQAQVFARGQVRVEMLEPLTCRPVWKMPGDYPVATSLLQSLFVRAGGWQAAVALSVVCLFLTVLAAAILLRGEGLSPLFALLVLSFPPALVLGRTAISDVPCAALVAAMTALFFAGSGERRGRWFFAGLLGGLSLTVREAAPIFCVAYFAAPFLRREKGAWTIGAGVACGVASWILTSLVIYGQPIYLRDNGYGFSLAAFLTNAPYHFAVLCLTVPASLLCAIDYRGRRRPEVMLTVAIVFIFFSSWGFAGWESGGLKQLILGPRYFLPLVPTLVLAVAEVATRRSPNRGSTALAVSCALTVAVAAFAVHPVMERWNRAQQEIADKLYAESAEDSAVITNELAMVKFYNEALGRRAFSNRATPELMAIYNPAGLGGRSVLAEDVPAVLRHCGVASVALLDRSDTGLWLDDAKANQEFVDELAKVCSLESVIDHRVTATDRFRLWRVTACASAGTAGDQNR